MCGIAGIVRFAAPAAADAERARRLGEALAHRGPDGAGCVRDATGLATLVHRRLAIIDPTDRAAQPMVTADGRFHLVYNGEIYNYRELRTLAERDGAELRTSSDTEVLLHLVARRGPAVLAECRGMFAFALWDARERSLLVARDRFGIKPLYLAKQADGIAFASELTALREADLLDGAVSPAGVLAFLEWASVPAPLTIFAGAESVEPGAWRRWDAGGHETRGLFADARAAYVDDDAASDDLQALRERAAVAVRDTVRAHLVADVPVGVFLSGGIDSGAIVSTARGLTSGDLHTYTVSVAQEAYSEAGLAAEVAARFGTVHHELRVDGSHIDRDLDTIIGRLDQPTADAVNSYYVSQAVAQTGIKAVLSGVGGDEMFGGYPSFRRLPKWLRMTRAAGPFLSATGMVAGMTLPAWQAAKWRQFAAAPGLATGYRALRGFFMPAELATLAGPALRDSAAWAAAQSGAAAADARLLTPAGPEKPAASIARMETLGFLSTQLLRDIDAVSMAHGLEVRTPFVDHVLQRAIWPALGAHPEWLAGKRLLAQSLAEPLPDAIVSRPKQGFTLPFGEWLRGPLRQATRDGLEALRQGGWISPDGAEATWAAFERGDAHWSRVWGLGVLGRFVTAKS